MSNSTSPLISPSSLTVGSTNTPPTTAPSSPLCKDDIIEDGKKAATEEGVRTGDDENTPEEEVEPQPTKKDAASKKGFPTATAKRKASNASTESKPKKARQSKAAAKSTPKGGKSTAKKNATPTKGKDDNDSDGGNDGGAKDTEPPSSQSRSWSSEMDAMVMDMAKNGHKDAEIKDSIHSKFKCDRSISAIKQRRQALEAKSAKWSKDEEQQLIAFADKMRKKDKILALAIAYQGAQVKGDKKLFTRAAIEGKIKVLRNEGRLLLE